MAAGLTQAQLAAAAEGSQQVVSDAERGAVYVSVEMRCRLTAACGYELGWRLHPVTTVTLRDSGQLHLVQTIAQAAHSNWAAEVERPIAPGDMRAADLVLASPVEVLHIEVERALVDVQAQVRAAQLKRVELVQRESRPVRLVMAFPDTSRNRARLAPLSELMAKTFPIRSGALWRGIRAGTAIGADGVLFVRTDGGRSGPDGASTTSRPQVRVLGIGSPSPAVPEYRERLGAAHEALMHQQWWYPRASPG